MPTPTETSVFHFQFADMGNRLQDSFVHFEPRTAARLPHTKLYVLLPLSRTFSSSLSALATHSPNSYLRVSAGPPLDDGDVDLDWLLHTSMCLSKGAQGFADEKGAYFIRNWELGCLFLSKPGRQYRAAQGERGRARAQPKDDVVLVDVPFQLNASSFGETPSQAPFFTSTLGKSRAFSPACTSRPAYPLPRSESSGVDRAFRIERRREPVQRHGPHRACPPRR